MSALRVVCPAKINLGLRVLGRRSDGFHELATIFQTIDLADSLAAERADALVLDVDDPDLPRDGANLVLRAATLLRERVPAARGAGARLRLSKAIPVGGGLGGGSSDAAGSLVLLDALWDLGLDRETLLALASEVGSDVPFFLLGGTALGTGRGEMVRALPSIETRPLVLGTPPFGLPTPEVYARLRAPLTPPGAGVTVAQFLVKLAEGNDFARVVNDLEAAAFAMHGGLASFKNALLSAGAEPALLSGSGSSVFGMFRAGAETEAIAASLRQRFPDWTVRAVRTSTECARVVGT